MKREDVRLADVDARMDRLPVTALHLAVVGVCATGFAFDLFEMAMGNVLGAVFAAPGSGVSPTQLSWLLASVYLGAIVGAPLLGHLSDRFGRRRMLAAALAWLTATSAWAMCSGDVVQLTVARVLSGIALGAYPPLMMSYLTDLMPSRHRGRLILWTCGLAALGLPGGVFLVRSLGSAAPLGVEPWRWAFLLGTLGAGVVSLLVLRLPESPRWLRARGRHGAAEAACRRFERSRVVRLAGGAAETAGAGATEASAGAGAGAAAAAAPADPRSPWPWVTGLFFLSPFATVAFPLLMGTVLTARGFRLSDTLLFVGLSTFGPAIGSIASAWIADRVERRLALGVCAVAMIASGWAFVGVESRFWLGVAAVVFGIAAILYTTAINLYAAELFPTRQRASGTATAWACNRIGAAIGLLALLPLLQRQGALVMFGVIGGSLVLSLALLVAAPRGRVGQAVA